MDLLPCDKKYSSLMENLPVGLIIFNPQQEVIFSNSVGAKYHGETRDGMLKKTLSQLKVKLLHQGGTLLCGKDYPLQRLLAKEKIENEVLGIISPNHKRPVWTLCNGYPVLGEDGQLVLLVLTFTDITQYKENEDRLLSSIKEKEILMQETHHRVKNNLAVIMGLLDMQRRRINDHKTNLTLQELNGRIQAMALVHEKLYHSANLSRINFQNYLQTLFANLMTTYLPEDHINLKIDAQDVELDLDTAIPCGLIAYELVTNSFQHAFPKGRPSPLEECEISLLMSQENDIYRLEICDNGIGLPSTMALSGVQSIGLLLVRMLGQHQLGGTIEIFSGPGTRFLLQFKV